MAGIDDDTIFSEGQRAEIAAHPGPSLGELFAEHGVDEADLRGDEAAFDYVSDAPPTHGVPRSDAEDQRVKEAATIAATLKNPRARNMVKAADLKNLEDIYRQSASLPVADIQTYVKGKKVNVDGSVIAIINTLDKRTSLVAIERFLQAADACKGDKRIINADGSKSVEPCPCPTHRLARCAQATGFRDKPLVWLNQHLQVELQNFDAFRLLPEDGTWQASIDETRAEKSIPMAMAQLIGPANVQLLQSLCRNKCSIMTGLRIFVEKICTQAEEIRKPTDYAHRFDV